MNGKAAFVVGATGGLGRAACHALARDWDGVAIGYRSSIEKAQSIADEMPANCQGLPVHCDLTDASSFQSALHTARDHFGSIATMVFASGVAIEQPFVSKISEEQWREVIETELIGLMRVVSVANYTFPPGDALSSVPKAGMEALGRAIAKEEGKFGIRANMVAPGIIDAGLGSHFIETLYSPEIWESQKKGVALRRFGTGEEIAEAIAFLASDRASYITGQTLIVDGGFSL
jgi:NAD(P)-dependent dehydrogenase (short-subunit alcohol dehydrogenase family)